VTIVGPDGVVEGDSDDPDAFGHPIGDAPEIAMARNPANVFGRAQRALSPGGPIEYLVAVSNTDGRVVRLAVPLGDLERTRGRLRNRLLLGFALAVAVALALGLLAVRAVTRPLRQMTQTAERLARGDYDVGAPRAAPDELGVLSRTLASLAGEIQRQVGELTDQRDLLSAVIGGLVEGVVVVDRDGAGALANPAARALIRH